MISFIVNAVLFIVFMAACSTFKEKGANIGAVLCAVGAAIFAIRAGWQLFGFLVGLIGGLVALLICLALPIAIIVGIVFLVKAIFKNA